MDPGSRGSPPPTSPKFVQPEGPTWDPAEEYTNKTSLMLLLERGDEKGALALLANTPSHDTCYAFPFRSMWDVNILLIHTFAGYADKWNTPLPPPLVGR